MEQSSLADFLISYFKYYNILLFFSLIFSKINVLKFNFRQAYKCDMLLKQFIKLNQICKISQTQLTFIKYLIHM